MKNENILLRFALSLMFFLVFSTVIAVYAESLVKIEKTWTCDNGFNNCFKEGCMSSNQLKMENNQYSFTFNAPKSGDYKCTITAFTSHFGFTCGAGVVAEQNEKTEILLNGKSLGTTEDPYCNAMSECIKEPCKNNVPGGDDGLIPSSFCQYLSGGQVCTAGHATFRVPNLGSELVAGDEERLTIVFVLGNTKNRNLISGRVQYLASENRFILKIGGGSCSGCWSCCSCIGDGTMNDAFCGSQVYRPQCPTFDINADSQDFKISWYPSSNSIGNGVDVCIEKVGTSGKVCFSDSFGIVQDPPGISFDSYCMAPNHCHDERLPDRFFSEKNVQLVDSSCTAGTAGYSCFVNGYGVGMRSSTCSGTGGGGAVCGNNIAEGSEVCDGTDKRGETCRSLGYVRGNLKCKADCTDFDESLCNDCVGAPCGGECCRASEDCENNQCVSKSR
jgi:hypothetical protein